MLAVIDLTELETDLCRERRDEQRQLAFAAARAFNVAIESGTLTSSSLDPIASAIEHGSGQVSDLG